MGAQIAPPPASGNADEVAEQVAQSPAIEAAIAAAVAEQLDNALVWEDA